VAFCVLMDRRRVSRCPGRQRWPPPECPESSVAAYARGAGLRAAGRVLAASSLRYAKAAGDIGRAQAKAALTPEERDALAGKK
jgi:hypothetical protein